VITFVLVHAQSLPGRKEIIMLDAADIQNWPKIIEQTQTNILLAYNPRLYEIINNDDFGKCDLSNMAVILCGGTYMSPDMYFNVKKKFKLHTKSEYFPVITR